MSDEKPNRGPGGAHSHSRGVDWMEASRIAEEFKAGERATHQARIAARAEARKAKRLGDMEHGVYGPPDPRKLWKWRPPMK